MYICTHAPMAGFALETGGPGVVLNGSCSGGGIVVSGNVSSIMTFNACSLAFLVYFVCLRFGCCVGCVGWVDRLRCRGLLLIRGSCRLCPWSGAARLGFGLVRSGSGCRFLVLGAPVGPLLDLGGGCVRVHLRVDRLRVGCVCLKKSLHKSIKKRTRPAGQPYPPCTTRFSRLTKGVSNPSPKASWPR